MRNTRPLILVSKLLRLSGFLLLFSALLCTPYPVHAATWTVNTTDVRNDGTCDTHHCSLPEAVDMANEHSGPDVIHFNIPGTGPHDILINRDIRIEDDATTIDGTTQPGYSNAPEGYGTPAVVLVGIPYEDPYHGTVPATPIMIDSDNNVIRGLSLINCADADFMPWAVNISGSRNMVERNYINTYPGGEACEFAGNTFGVQVGNNSWPRDSSYFSGGTIANSIIGNVIATRHIGIHIQGADDTVVQGNRIGTDPAGSSAPYPYFSGVYDRENSIGTLIGGSEPGEGNLIARAYVGILAMGESTQIIGNQVGTDATGTAAIPNYMTGVWVMGTGCLLEDNLISGSPVGVQVGGEYRGGEISVGDTSVWAPYPGGFDIPLLFPGRDTIITGNRIGTNLSGTSAIPNEKGILLEWNAETAQIGGAGEGEGNLISGNDFGIEIKGGTPLIIGNSIGTDITGTSAIPNEYGILVWDRAGIARIGDNYSGTGNLISGNSRIGIWFRADSGVILLNWVGISLDGTRAIPNGTGIEVDGDYNTIGGMVGLGNIISGNETGLVIDGDNNQAFSNFIGTDPTGSVMIPNGVGVYLGGSRNIFGNTFAPNIVSGNDRGLVITGSYDTINKNSIGTNLATTLELPNAVGIELLGPYNYIGTDSLAGNKIMYNNGPGILVSSLAVGNSIAYNTIAFNAQEGIRLEPGGGVSLNTISRNSLFRNSWLGIDLLSGAQDDIAAPVLENIRMVEGSDAFLARGSTCPGCLVELFLADPDRSGSGEGKTYVASARAEDESFMITIPSGTVTSLCQLFTVTATDRDGNTSEFSGNVTPVGCLRIRWPFILIGVISVLIPSAILGWISGRRRDRPGLGVATGTAAGGLLAVLVIVILTHLPFIQVITPQVPVGGEPASPSLPPCAQFIGTGQIRPEEMVVFDLGTDVLFELSPQPDPPGFQTSWTMVLAGPGGIEFSQVLPSLSTTLSGLGINAPVAGTYAWRLSAERFDPGSGEWQPLCADIRDHVFFLVQPQSVSETPTASTLEATNCRSGPSMDFPLLSILPAGSQYQIQARNTSGDSWMIFDPAINTACWVAGNLVEVLGDTSLVQIIDPMPPETPEPDQPTAVDCSQWSNNQQACIANSACQWNPNLNPTSPCVNK